MSRLATVVEQTTTDKLVVGVLAALERYREQFDEDPDLVGVDLEVKLVARGTDPQPGVDVGDVRMVVVKPVSVFRASNR